MNLSLEEKITVKTKKDIMNELINIKKNIDLINDFNICFSISNFGYLIKRIEKMKTISYDGNFTTLDYDKYNVLTNNGTLVFNEWYDDITFEMKDNYCIFGIHGNKKYGVFDINGKILIDPLYDKLYYDSDNIFLAKVNNKFGFVTTNGHLTPIIFQDLGFFYDDMAAVRYSNKWGFINKITTITNPNDNMQYSIYPQYDKVDDFENGVCSVELNNEKFIIDKNNNKLNSIKILHR